jgi:hypothetical protein
MGFSKLRKKAKEKAQGGLLVNLTKGDNDIRILPNKYAPELVFVEAWVHYANSGISSKTFFSPKTWGEADPVLEFVEEQTKVNLPKEDYFRITNMAPKPVYLVPVVKRGVEEEGVKWLSLSGGKWYQGDHEPEGQFGRLMENYENVFRKRLAREGEADVTDIEEGHDLLIKIIPKEETDNDYGKVEYQFDYERSHVLPVEMIDTKEGKELLNALIKEQPEWGKIYPRYSTEEVERMFDKYMEADTDDVDDSELEDDSEEEVDTVTYGEDQVDEEDVLAKADEVFDGDDFDEEDFKSDDF